MLTKQPCLMSCWDTYAEVKASVREAQSRKRIKTNPQDPTKHSRGGDGDTRNEKHSNRDSDKHDHQHNSAHDHDHKHDDHTHGDAHSTGQDHDHDKENGPEHKRDHKHRETKGKDQNHTDKHGHENSSDHSHGHENDHKHDHKHEHKHGHEHSHDHDHEHHGHGHGHGHAHEHHDHSHENRFGISSFAFTGRRPFNPQRLNAVLAGLNVTSNSRTDQRDASSPLRRVIRSKGFAWISPFHNQMFYWSHAGAHIELAPAGTWWASLQNTDFVDDEIKKDFDGPFGDRRQEIVFIGIHMDQPAIEAKLEAALLTPQEFDRYKTFVKTQSKCA